MNTLNRSRHVLFTLWSLFTIISVLVCPLKSPASEIESYFSQQFNLNLANVYWGEFHGHSSYSSDAENVSNTSNVNKPGEAYAYARDVQDLDFVALSDHADMVDRSEMPLKERLLNISMWESLYKIGLKYNNEDPTRGKVFIIFPGYEYTNTYGVKPVMGSFAGYGHKNVIFRNLVYDGRDDRCGAGPMNVGTPIFALPCYAPTAGDLYDILDRYRPVQSGMEGEMVAIIHTPANTGNASSLEKSGGMDDHRVDWDVLDGDFNRNLEIYSKWGNSEGPPPEDLAGQCPDEDLYNYSPVVPGVPDPITIRNVLYTRWVLDGDSRFVQSFLGGTDGHSGRPAAYDYSGDMNYEGAVTGLIAPALNRGDLWSALWNRHTLACTTSRNGKRIPLLFAVETGDRHLLMGDMGPHDGSARVRVITDPDVYRIDVIVDGCVDQVLPANTADIELDLPQGRHFIYVRAYWSDNGVEGQDGRVWSSPVYLY